MTNPYYAGDGNNLTRLTIPSMGQIEDAPTQRGMQAILQWANRLTAVTQLIAGTGITLDPTDGIGPVEVSSSGGVSITGFGIYKPTGIDSFNSVGDSPLPAGGTFARVAWASSGAFTYNWNYLTATHGRWIVPNNSLTLVIQSLSLVFSGNLASQAAIDIEIGGSALYSANRFTVPDNTAIDFYASPVCVSIVDTFAAPLSNVFDTFLFSTLSSPAVSVFNGSSPWGAGYTIFVSLSVSE
jgi:hypothetical protein